MSEQSSRRIFAHRKAWLGGGIAAAAAVVVAQIAFEFPLPKDVVGTIIPAQRYRAAQNGSEQVQLGAPAGQAAPTGTVPDASRALAEKSAAESALNAERTAQMNADRTAQMKADRIGRDAGRPDGADECRSDGRRCRPTGRRRCSADRSGADEDEQMPTGRQQTTRCTPQMRIGRPADAVPIGRRSRRMPIGRPRRMPTGDADRIEGRPHAAAVSAESSREPPPARAGGFLLCAAPATLARRQSPGGAECVWRSRCVPCCAFRSSPSPSPARSASPSSRPASCVCSIRTRA